MMPAAKELFMYVSMDSLSGVGREKRCPLGVDVPGCRSIAQSYGRWGSSDVTPCFTEYLLIVKVGRQTGRVGNWRLIR